ncbi:MAG: hypothetical protein SNF93_02200 [Rikenellaceae bacterium]
MEKWQKYTLFSLAWLGVAAYIIFAATSARSYHKALRVSDVKISVIDSSAVANLVSRSMVEKWIKESKIQIKGQAVDSLRLVDLEEYISASGFVERVNCYTTYSGELHIEVSQLRPIIRVMLNGYNSYITQEGYVFARPASSSRYTQVVTGSYTPLFRAGYSGNIHQVYRAQHEEIEAELRRSETKDIYPLYAQRVKIREELRTVNSRYIDRRFGEGRKAFDERVAQLKERNANDRARLQRESYENDKAIEKEQRKQKVYIDKQKKLEKKYKDFINLITFVKIVENDKFWSSEIVQIVASESTSGDLRLELIPRSGEHTIIFGECREIEEKLKNAKKFYREVLPHQGWGKFKSINVEYKNQIVCK